MRTIRSHLYNVQIYLLNQLSSCYVGTAQKTLIFEALKNYQHRDGNAHPRLSFFDERAFTKMREALLPNPNRNLRELQVEGRHPLQLIVESLQQALLQYTWTPGNHCKY